MIPHDKYKKMLMKEFSKRGDIQLLFTEKDDGIIRKHIEGEYVIMSKELLVELLKEKELVKHLDILDKVELFSICDNKYKYDVFIHAFNIIVHILSSLDSVGVGFYKTSGLSCNDSYELIKMDNVIMYGEELTDRIYKEILGFTKSDRPFDDNETIYLARMCGITDYIDILMFRSSEDENIKSKGVSNV